MADALVPSGSRPRKAPAAARQGGRPPRPRSDPAAEPFAGPHIIDSKITPDSGEKEESWLGRLDAARRAFNKTVPKAPLWPDKPPPRVW